MRALVLLLAACLALAGCKKIFPTIEQYATVRGRLVRDCSLEPLAGATVGFGTSKPSKSIIGPERFVQTGEVVTNADGTFEVKLKTADMGPMFIGCRLAGSSTDIELGPYAPKDSLREGVLELGNVYVERVPVYVNVVANIGPGLRAKDSLVVNYKGTPIAYSPVPAQIHINDVSKYMQGPETDNSNGVNLIYTHSLTLITKPEVNGENNTNVVTPKGKVCNVGTPDTVTLDW